MTEDTVRPRKMLRHTPTIVILVGGLLTGQVRAFDAPPPPDPKTMEWTIEQANYLIPEFDAPDVKISDIIEWLDSSMGMPGFYIDIDKSEVAGRLDKKLTIQTKEIRWISVLGKVADAIDADIEITPGKFKLVPRKKTQPAGKNNKDEQGAGGQAR